MKVYRHDYDNMGEKNHFDDQLRMEITPEMQRMFEASLGGRNPDNEGPGGAIKYKEVTPGEIRTRTISEMEYSQLAPYQTSAVRRIPYGQLAVMLALIAVLTFCVLNNLDALKLSEMVIMVGFIGVLVVVAILKVISVINMTVKHDSQIAEGSVIFFSEEHIRRNSNKTRNSYYVSVALHDQQTYIKKVKCHVRDYRYLQLNSKVLVVIKGAKAFAVAEPRN